MTNKELQEALKQHPDDMEVLLNKNGAIFTKVMTPYVKFMGTAQKHYIILDTPIS